MEDQIGLYWLVIQRTAACCLPRRSTPLILHGLYDSLPGMVGGIGVAFQNNLEWAPPLKRAPCRSVDPLPRGPLRPLPDRHEDRGEFRPAGSDGVSRVRLELVEPPEGRPAEPPHGEERPHHPFCQLLPLPEGRSPAGQKDLSKELHVERPKHREEFPFCELFHMMALEGPGRP